MSTDVRRLAICYVPQPGERAVTAEVAWRDQLQRVLNLGLPSDPRSRPTRELLHTTVTVDSLYPVVCCPARRLGYRFMATEALWILRGQNDLKTLADVLPRYRDYSDDGVTLAGAYGPKILAQLDYVVEKLLADPATRQATLTIWERCPAPSKDVPCTVAMSFSLRAGQLHSHVYMRSSDVWRGLPYDIFSFSAVLWLVVATYNQQVRPYPSRRAVIEPGNLSVTATSSHLYEPEWQLAREVLGTRTSDDDLRLFAPVIDVRLLHEGRTGALLDVLAVVAGGASTPALRVMP